jgi:hypothetical protein
VRTRRVCVAALLSLLTATRFARADEDPLALFEQAHASLEAGRPTEAIAELEALGDRGIVDPVISFDRGLAYASRVHAGAEKPGDLGRAAHGFEEARELSDDPRLLEDAVRALASVRAEVARRRAHAGEPVEIDIGDSLGRSIVRLLPENVWATLAAVFAAFASVAILARARASAARAKVAAATTLGIAGALLVATTGLAYAARDARLHVHEAVIVAPAARLLDERHLALSGLPPLPEGSRVRLVHESAGFSRVVLGGAEGFLASSALLPIAKR